MPFNPQGQWMPSVNTSTLANPQAHPTGQTPQNIAQGYAVGQMAQNFNQYAPNPQASGPQYMQQAQSAQPVPMAPQQMPQYQPPPQLGQSITQQVGQQANPASLQSFLQQGNQQGAGASNAQFNGWGQQGQQAQGGFQGFQTNGQQAPQLGYTGSTQTNLNGLQYQNNGSNMGAQQMNAPVQTTVGTGNQASGISLAANQYQNPNNMFYNNPLKTPLSPSQTISDDGTTPRAMPTRNDVSTSDQAAKTDIKSGQGDLQEFIDALGVYSYEYKEKEHGDKRYISPMAQELEKSTIGKSAVEVDPVSGYKQVHYGRIAGATLSAVAMVNAKQKSQDQKIKELESKLSQAIKLNMKNKGKK